VAIHIGQEIRKRVKERGMTITHFAKRVGSTPKTIHAAFKRPSIDTMLLKKCSKELEFDFFALYSQDLKIEGATTSKEPGPKYAKTNNDAEMEIVIRPGQNKELFEQVLKILKKGG
jgi:hypothetical protein